ncbi:MAG TPA: hypothetical protein VFP33_04945 [Gallionella sp.]|nr:hypothetical protein [Gallionella sp.]
MTPNEFVRHCAQEKTDLLAAYFNPTADTAVGAAIASLQLSTEQREAMKTILDTALTDAFYTMLLALDGEASLGGKQESYRLVDSEGNLIAGGGELEAAAWQNFQSEQP